MQVKNPAFSLDRVIEKLATSDRITIVVWRGGSDNVRSHPLGLGRRAETRYT